MSNKSTAPHSGTPVPIITPIPPTTPPGTNVPVAATKKGDKNTAPVPAQPDSPIYPTEAADTRPIHEAAPTTYTYNLTYSVVQQQPGDGLIRADAAAIITGPNHVDLTSDHPGVVFNVQIASGITAVTIVLITAISVTDSTVSGTGTLTIVPPTPHHH